MALAHMRQEEMLDKTYVASGLNFSDRSNGCNEVMLRSSCNLPLFTGRRKEGSETYTWTDHAKKT